MTESDVTESYLRANVGYTRATNSLLMASPLDMAGLPGVFQTLAMLLTGVTTIYRPPSYYNFAISNALDAREISGGEWDEMTNGATLGAFPPPLALVQVSARRHRNEIAQQHVRVRGNEMPVDQLTNIKMSRLRLTLVDGHRVHPTVWTPASTRYQRHPAWPGGNYQHELVWAYAEDGTTRPTWILLPHPTRNNQYILCNNFTSHQYGARQGEQFTLLMPLPKMFFYESYRRHLTENSPLQAHCSSMSFPVMLTNPSYPNSMNDYQRLHPPRLASPRLAHCTREPSQGTPILPDRGEL